MPIPTECEKCGHPLDPAAEICPSCQEPVEKKKKNSKGINIEPGTILAERYRIITEIGKGGMGFVYLAEELAMGLSRNVAIKILPPQFVIDQSRFERFREEIKIAATFDHPNIIPIYFVGQQGNFYFYVMKFLEGETVNQLLRKKHVFSEKEVRRIGAIIADALGYAHKKGYVHRDVKASNIMISPEGKPTLMDFGVARAIHSSEITSDGQIVGTIETMAPEQWFGESEPRSDLYSLGVVMFQMITGSLPFSSKNPYEMMKFHQEVIPSDPREKNPAISEDLAKTILICLAKERNRRYQDAWILKDVLEEKLPPDVGNLTIDKTSLSAGPSMDSGLSAGEFQETDTTGLIDRAPEELTGVHRQIWELKRESERFYSVGDLEKAIKSAKKIVELDEGDHQSALDRVKKLENLQNLIEIITSRAGRLAEQLLLHQALEELDKLLQCHNVPMVKDLYSKIEAKIKQAEHLVTEGKFLFKQGKTKKALKKFDAAIKIDYENPEVHRYKTEIQKRYQKKTKKPRAPVITKRRLIIVLLLAIVPPMIYYSGYFFNALGNIAYDMEWFADPSVVNAFNFYQLAKKLGDEDPKLTEKIERLPYEVAEKGAKALLKQDFVTAEKYFQQAVQMDPLNPTFSNQLSQIRTRLEVRRSLGK